MLPIMQKNENQPSSALVVFSGGQDSTTCLHWAIQKFTKVSALFFRYGQRHHREEKSAKKIASLNNIDLKIITLDFFKDMGGNALIEKDITIEHSSSQLPNTFVPGRNLIFLSYAASYGYQKNINDIVTGVCQADYSGYPDCRDNTMSALAQALSLGLDRPIKIHTPLMFLSKSESITLAKSVGALESIAFSHTCYEGQYPPCGKCPSCLLRQKGFSEVGLIDPLIKRWKTNN
jgi:7-cyano-7-deazaguanine synthase